MATAMCQLDGQPTNHLEFLCLQQSQQQQHERVSLGTLSVAPIAFGTVNHFDNDVETAAVILQQVPPGTLVDTAELYGGGNAETILGKAIEQNQAKKGEGEKYMSLPNLPPPSCGKPPRTWHRSW